MKIELKRNSSYRWYKSDDVFSKGYIFDENGNIFENEELITCFNSNSSLNQLFFTLLTIEIKDIFLEFNKTFLNSGTLLVKFPMACLTILKMLISLKKK